MEDHPPVPVVGFINKLMVMRTNDNQLFLEEFGSVPMTMPHMSTDTANSHINKPKNRYNNILPYDATRVKLKGSNGDYINANYCSVSWLGSYLYCKCMVLLVMLVCLLACCVSGLQKHQGIHCNSRSDT